MAIAFERVQTVRCKQCHDDVLSPFAVITRFEPEETVTMDQCPNVGHLTEQCDALRSSENSLFALKVDGHFDYVRTRAMCPHCRRVQLVQAAAVPVQPEFEFSNVSGTARRLLDARECKDVQRSRLPFPFHFRRPPEWRSSPAMPRHQFTAPASTQR